jgi:hypothetical protein
MTSTGSRSPKALAILALLFAALSLPSCRHASGPARESSPRIDTEQVSLEEAKRLIHSGEVKWALQPHQGPVLLRMQDDRWFCFDQPHLDWIIGYLDQHGLSDTFPLAIE